MSSSKKGRYGNPYDAGVRRPGMPTRVPDGRPRSPYEPRPLKEPKP